jgi:hypothetical protein
MLEGVCVNAGVGYVCKLKEGVFVGWKLVCLLAGDGVSEILNAR